MGSIKIINRKIDPEINSILYTTKTLQQYSQLNNFDI